MLGLSVYWKRRGSKLGGAQGSNLGLREFRAESLGFETSSLGRFDFGVSEFFFEGKIPECETQGLICVLGGRLGA